MEQTIEQRTILEKGFAKIFIDRENAMAMCDIYQLKGHTGGAFYGIFVSAGRTETAVTAERNEFQFTTIRACKESTAIRRITTMNHLVNIFNDSRTRMEFVNDVFIIIGKDGL